MTTIAFPYEPDPGEIIPEHPFSVPMTRAVWDVVERDWLHDQPQLAEYSYVSLDLWRGGVDISVSRIGPVLVVTFTDVPGQAMFVASPGTVVDGPTAIRLAKFAGEHEVRFLSEPTAEVLLDPLERAGFSLLSERNNHDYVVRLEELVGFQGLGHRGKQRTLARFVRRHPEAVVTRGRLADDWAYEHLIATTRRWRAVRFEGVDVLPAAVEMEFDGAQHWRRSDAGDRTSVYCLVMPDDRPAGVAVVEQMADLTLMGVYFKADRSIPGAAEFLRSEVARANVAELGPLGLWSLQQDDGIPGLRAAKLSLHPVRMHEKFAVVRRTIPTGGH